MYPRRMFTLLCITAALALTPGTAGAESIATPYEGAPEPATNVTPPSSAPGASDAVTQPVSGDDALGNAAGAVDDQSVEVIPGELLVPVATQSPARAARGQLPFTGAALGVVASLGLALLAAGLLMVRLGGARRRDSGRAAAR